MPSLRETQLAFADAVLADSALGLLGQVVEGGFSAEERLRIYRNNAHIGFHQALRAAYPVIEQLGGAEWFESTARRFQRQYPSRCGDLQYVGTHFASFLRAELSGTDYEYFEDVARLEWAYQEVLVAADSAALDPAELAPLSSAEQERVVFAPRTALRLVESRVPVLDIWKDHQPVALPRMLDLDACERHTLVMRRLDHVEMREIPSSQAALLSLFQRGLPLDEAQLLFTQRLPAADLGAALVGLVQLQALASIGAR